MQGIVHGEISKTVEQGHRGALKFGVSEQSARKFAVGKVHAQILGLSMEWHCFLVRTDLLPAGRVCRLKQHVGVWRERIQHPSSAETGSKKQLAGEQKICCLFSLVAHCSKVLYAAT